MIKEKIKSLEGLIRANVFGICAGKDVSIGKSCSLKGKKHITLENAVIIRYYAKIWSGGQ